MKLGTLSAVDSLEANRSTKFGHLSGGRGLLIVGALADRWGVDLGPAPRKTVWAEVDLVRFPPPPGRGNPRPGGP